MGGRAPRSQGGYSLLEMIVVLAIVGSLIGALASGLLTSATVTNHAKDRQRLGFAMTSITEALRQVGYYDTTGSATCTVATHATEYLQRYGALTPEERAATDGMTIEITDIAFWTPVSFPTSTTVANQWGGSCAADGGVQRVRIRLSLPSNTGGRSMTGEVVIRKPK